MTPLSPEPCAATFAERWWRTIALVVSVLLIAGAVYEAGRESTDTARNEARRAALALCLLQAQGRVEGNARYYVEVDFIHAAIEAREEAATSEHDPKQRAIDRDAASNYRTLLTRIHPLPIPDCSEVIP